MSFAIIQTGGKQYKVSASEILKIEKLNSQVGKTVEFKNILFLNDDKNTEIGNPVIKGAKVEATILKNTKNRTVLVFKKRRRKNSRKKYGHRQPISLIKITKIFSKEGKIIAQADGLKKFDCVIANPPFSSIDGPVFFTPPVIMFKLARSRPFAAAFKPSKVSDLQLKKNIVSTQPDANSYQVYSPSRLAGVAQQKRALSIHEYLSADLLRQVCESMLMGWIRSL